MAPKPETPAYGIDNAIALMRTLPIEDEPDLVLRVVRKTLRSTGISVEQIIDSAKDREGALSASVEAERSAIEELERLITARRETIARTQTQLAETRSAREHLEEALRNETSVGPRLAQHAARLQAEARDAMAAAAAASSNAGVRPGDPKGKPPVAPRSQAPSVPTSVAAPTSASGATQVRKKLVAPKLQERKPPKPTAPEAPATAAGKPGLLRPDAEPAAPDEDPFEFLPKLSDEPDDLADEPTSRWLGRRPDVASRKR